MRVTFFFICMVVSSIPAYGQEHSPGVILHSHITGVRPTLEEARKIDTLLEDSKLDQALDLITDHDHFYNVKLRNIFSAWSNEDGNTDVPLNDMIAILIGVVRDGLPFHHAFTEDILYIGSIDPPYNSQNNAHYQAMDDSGVSLKEALTKVKQSETTGLPLKAVAGVLSSRGYGEAYFSAGTNRAATAFAFKNFICRDMENLHDITQSDYRVRRDVDRLPGGDPKVFRNRCVGCHSGMDAQAGWAAYYDFADNQLVYTDGQVQPKMNNNAFIFSDGYEVTDDSWINLWTKGTNAALGWPETRKSGSGAISWAKMLTATEAFSTCMAQTVFVNICHQDPEATSHQQEIVRLGREFKEHANFRKLVAATAKSCLVEER